MPTNPDTTNFLKGKFYVGPDKRSNNKDIQDDRRVKQRESLQRLLSKAPLAHKLMVYDGQKLSRLNLPREYSRRVYDINNTVRERIETGDIESHDQGVEEVLKRLEGEYKGIVNFVRTLNPDKVREIAETDTDYMLEVIIINKRFRDKSIADKIDYGLGELENSINKLGGKKFIKKAILTGTLATILYLAVYGATNYADDIKGYLKRMVNAEEREGK